MYRPEIDGLRAFAILPVVLFHAGLGCPGGFIGVDIFFVISGFLIGGIVLGELGAGTFSFAKFWERRVRRILPALFFLLMVALVITWACFAEDARDLVRQAIWVLTGLANVKMLALTGGYFARAADSLYLLHTWSLAVEEQFYLLLPVLLFVAHRWFRRRIGLLLLGIFFCSLFLSVYWSNQNYPGNFYLLPSRAWELLLGCLGAWALHQGRVVPERYRTAAVTVGLLAIVVAVATFHEDSRWPGIAALSPCGGTLLVLMSPAQNVSSPVLWLISTRPFRFIGLISYSVYLWHWPLIVFLKQHGPVNFDIGVGLGAVAGSIALGTASWLWLEQPFRNKFPRLRIRTQPMIRGALVAWVFLLLLSIIILNRPARMGVEAIANWPALESINKYDATGHIGNGGLRFDSSSGPCRCVVLGTSHGMMLGAVVEALSEEYHLPCAFFCRPRISGLFPVASAGTWPDPFGKQPWDDQVKEYLSEWKPGLVIIGGRWYWEMTDRQQFSADHPLSFEREFTNTVKWIAEHGWRVVVVGQVPELPFDRSVDVKGTIRRQYRANGNVMPRYREDPELREGRRRALLTMRHLAGANAAVLDPDPLLHFPDHSIRYFGTNGVFYGDEHHLNSLGAMELKPLLEPFFREVSKE